MALPRPPRGVADLSDIELLRFVAEATKISQTVTTDLVAARIEREIAKRISAHSLATRLSYLADRQLVIRHEKRGRAGGSGDYRRWSLSLPGRLSVELGRFPPGYG